LRHRQKKSGHRLLRRLPLMFPWRPGRSWRSRGYARPNRGLQAWHGVRRTSGRRRLRPPQLLFLQPSGHGRLPPPRPVCLQPSERGRRHAAVRAAAAAAAVVAVLAAAAATAVAVAAVAAAVVVPAVPAVAAAVVVP